MHHVYDVNRLRAAYFALKRDAAAGIDGETGQHYSEALEDHLRDLAARLTRGAFRAKSSPASVHPEDGRAAAAARRSHAGRQTRPARRRRGAQRHLRTGLSRLLVRVPAEAQPSSGARRAHGRHRDEEGELGARCGHSWVLRHAEPRMARPLSSSIVWRTGASCASSRSG